MVKVGDDTRTEDDASKKGDADIADRLSQAIDAAGGIARAHRETSISDSALRRYAEAKNDIPATKLRELANFTGVSVDWLIYGHGRVISEDEMRGISAPSDEIIAILPLVESGDAERLLLPKTFIQGRGARSARVRYFVQHGGGMSPTIDDGAVALVDPAQEDIVDGLIYVVSLCAETRIKRVHKTMSGKITLRSDGDQKLFPDEQLSNDDAAGLVIRGRVFWAEKML